MEKFYGDTATPTPKAPVYLDDLCTFARLLPRHTFEGARDGCACLLAFYGLLRIREYMDAGLRIRDVRFAVYGLDIDVTYSKTSLVRTTLSVAGRGDELCPSQALAAYYAHFFSVGLPARRDDPLFISFSSGAPAPMTADEFITRVRQLYSQAQPDCTSQKYAGHSFRRGGATALTLAGVADSDIQRHGRWKSDAYKLYLPRRLAGLPPHRHSSASTHVVGRHQPTAVRSCNCVTLCSRSNPPFPHAGITSPHSSLIPWMGRGRGRLTFFANIEPVSGLSPNAVGPLQQRGSAESRLRMGFPVAERFCPLFPRQLMAFSRCSVERLTYDDRESSFISGGGDNHHRHWEPQRLWPHGCFLLRWCGRMPVTVSIRAFGTDSSHFSVLFLVLVLWFPSRLLLLVLWLCYTLWRVSSSSSAASVTK